MKANELRIGNYVYDDYLKKNKQINGIFDNEIWLSEIGEDEFDQRSIIDSINPIPLTEEWLLKFGFKNLSVGLFELIHNNLIGYRLSIEGQYGYEEIKYIHQLQNLYYALIGEELTIN